MNTSYLHEFITLSQIGKYHEAADVLFISQSSLSKHIQSLEQELGVPLFRRTTQKIELTSYGAVFLPHAQKICEEQADMERELRRLQAKERRPVINIGASPIVPLHSLTNRITSFVQFNSNCEIRIANDSAQKLNLMLLQGKCDFIVVYDSELPSDQPWDSLFYADDRLAAVLPAGHPLTRHPSLKLENLEHEIFAETEKSPLADVFLPRVDPAVYRFHPLVEYQVDTVHQLLGLISRGMAISFLGEQSVKHFNAPGITVIPIEPEIPLHVSIFYRKTSVSGLTRELLKPYSPQTA